MARPIYILLYGLPLQSFSYNLALALSGHFKVVFLVDKYSIISGWLDDLDDDSKNFEVRTINLMDNSKNIRSIFSFIFFKLSNRFIAIRRLRVFLYSFLIRLRYPGVASSDLICIEKEGLVFSRHLNAERLGYYSLELEFDKAGGNKLYRYHRNCEKKLLQSVDFLVIQDPMRLASFSRNNNINIPAKFFPVSLLPSHNSSLPRKKMYWHGKFSLPDECKVLLYFGLIMEDRGILELIHSYDAGPDCALIIHGYGDPEFIEDLRQAATYKHVFFSLETVQSSMIPTLISSADVSLCWYQGFDDNNLLTAFSSEKIALSLRHGVPIITADNASYRALYAEFQCGLPIASLADINRAALSILENREKYQCDARLAFGKYYDLLSNAKSLADSYG